MKIFGSAIVAIFMLAASAKSVDDNVGFKGMEAYRFKHGAWNLKIADFNNDKLEDIVFINSKDFRMEILMRRKEAQKGDDVKHLEKYFKNMGFVTEQRVLDFDMGDLNGDGRVDLATVGYPLGIRIFFQKENGSFSDFVDVYSGKNSKSAKIRLVDIDKDGKPEIMLGRKNEIQIFKQAGPRAWKETKKMPLATGECQCFELADLDGDSIKDLVLFFSGNKLPVRIKKGLKNGGFGWEMPIDFPPFCAYDVVRGDKKSSADLGIILNSQKTFRQYRLESKKEESLLSLDAVSAKRLPLTGTSRGNKPSWIIADLNSDGYDDFCVAASKLSQLHIYFGSKTGFPSSPEKINTLSDVEKIVLDNEKNIIVYSSKEKALARHAAANYKATPVILDTPENPLSVAVAADGTYIVDRNKKEKRTFLRRIVWDARGKIKSSEFWQVDLKNPPNNLIMIQIASDIPGAIFFVPYQSPELFALKGKKLEKISSAGLKGMSAIRSPRLFLSKPGQMFICNKNIARCFQWGKDECRMKEQFNLASASSLLSGFCFYPAPDGKPGIMFFDSSANDLAWFPLKAEGEALKAKKIHLKGAFKNLKGMGSFKTDNGYGLLLVGQSDVAAIYPKPDNFYPKKLAEYTARTEEASFWDFRNVLMGKDKFPAIAILDQLNRSCEFIRLKDDVLKHVISIEIFKKRDGFNKKRNIYEPHDIASGDINGDGIEDLALLVHDRLLIYLGE